MYSIHPSFQSILDDAKIWRFMDLAKFCHLLEKKSLFFVKPSLFPDPWEGYLPSKHYVKKTYEDNYGKQSDFIFNQTKNILPKITREEFAVSCWHISDYESESFWRNYSNRGIAIQTTFGKLKKCFGKEDRYNIYIGKVEYKDPEIDTVDIGNVFNHILWKRKSFQHENELRAVIWQREDLNGKGVRPFDDDSGQEINIDADVLIDTLYTTPFEKDNWFNNLVADIIKRYSFKFACQKSCLMKKPF